MAKLLCGPIVGLVKDTSAIVLFEVDQDVSLECLLRDSKDNKVHRAAVTFPGRRATPVQFQDLSPESCYEISLTDSSGRAVGSKVLGTVRTLPEEVSRIKVAACSCDSMSHKPPQDMWERLYKAGTEGNVHVILHMGDNVYLDEHASAGISNREMITNSSLLLNSNKVDQNIPYVRARKVLSGLERSDWEQHRDTILEIFRDKYRKSWGRPSKARVLANFSNIMILDDHEVRDDFGLEPEDSNPESKEFFIAILAIQVYHEYQRQLWDPEALGKSGSLLNEFYSVTFGPLGIMLTDFRTSQGLYRPRRQAGDKSYYGREQSDEQKRLLKSGNQRMWLVLTTLPLLFLKKKLYELLKDLGRTDDVKAFITRYHETDLVPLLDMIRGFKGQTNDGTLPREVLLLAGDIHMAGFTDILCDIDGCKSFVCHQVTSSAINNCHISAAQLVGIRALMHFTEQYGCYIYRHYDWTKDCNFSLIDIDFSNPQDIQYSVNIVTANRTEYRNSKDPNWDKGTQTPTATTSTACCDIL